MALVDVGNSRVIPDNNGGWYWMKWANGNWEPAEVQKAKEDEVPIIVIAGTRVSVDHPFLRWGHQIFPPEK